METAGSGPHGEDPAAITDPNVMRDTWEQAATIARNLRDASPADIKDDVALVAQSVIDTNDLFSEHDYNLVEIAKNDELRSEFDKINQREGLAEASTRFNNFLRDNCPTT